MNLKTRLEAEVQTRRVQVSMAVNRLRTEQRQAEKNRVKLPKEMIAQMRDDIAQAERNVVAAAAALEAVCKCPPLAVLR